MNGRAEVVDSNTSEKKQHRIGRFTQGLLDNNLILQQLEIKIGQRVVDAGCGNGYMAKLFSSQVGQTGRVYALDPNEHFIKILSKDIQGGNVETLTADITKPTPLADSAIDLIYISTVTHIFSAEQMQGFLREAKRLLKPNAKLAIVEIEKKETSFGPPLESRYSPEELKDIVPMVPLKTVQAGEHFYMQVFTNK